MGVIRHRAFIMVAPVPSHTRLASCSVTSPPVKASVSWVRWNSPRWAPTC